MGTELYTQLMQRRPAAVLAGSIAHMLTLSCQHCKV